VGREWHPWDPGWPEQIILVRLPAFLPNCSALKPNFYALMMPNFIICSELPSGTDVMASGAGTGRGRWFWPLPPQTAIPSLRTPGSMHWPHSEEDIYNLIYWRMGKKYVSKSQRGLLSLYRASAFMERASVVHWR